MAFALSFDEFVMSILLAQGGVVTFPVQLFQYMRFSVNRMVAAISTVLIAATRRIALALQRAIGLDVLFGLKRRSCMMVALALVGSGATGSSGGDVQPNRLHRRDRAPGHVRLAPEVPNVALVEQQAARNPATGPASPRARACDSRGRSAAGGHDLNSRA